MKKISVKTNIMCGACIEKVTPSLDKAFGKGNWSVNIQDPKKILTVEHDDATEPVVIDAVTGAGYKAEHLQ